MPKKKKKASRPVRPASKFDRVLASSKGSSSVHPSLQASATKSSDLSCLVSIESSPQEALMGDLPAVPASVSSSVSALPDQIPSSSCFPVEAGLSNPKLPETLAISPPVVDTVCEISSTVVTSTLQGSSSSAQANLDISLPSVPNSVPSYADATKSQKMDCPWATKFKASLRNLKQMEPPSFLDDGTPVVVAPPSVLLKTAAMWKGHLVAQFHGLCPPSTKIFSDLNPIWGRYGPITVRIISETAALIFIPSTATRQWVVDIGFWQAGNCSCTVYPWSPDGLLELEELQSAPTWAVLKNVPPQLYSLEGISVIASGIGEPLHTEKSRLDPVNIGVTKVKVVIKLDSTLPSVVVVRDVQGNSARVAVEYPRPPPKCLNCGRYGHLISRCPKPLMKKIPSKKVEPSGLKEVTHPSIILPSSEFGAGSGKESLATPGGNTTKVKRRRSRSKKRSTSLPPTILLPLPVDKGKKVIASSSETGKKWVVKAMANRLATSQFTPTAAVVKGPRESVSTSFFTAADSVLGPSAIVLNSEERNAIVLNSAERNAIVDKPQVVIDDDLFPIPPGWGVMSKKTRKKLKKIWHNQMRSGAQALARGESSGGAATEANAASVLAATLPGWRMECNYCCSELGRIWLVWDPSVSVLVFKKSEQMILCSVKVPNIANSFAAAFVYGKNTDGERRLLWEEINSLSPSSPLKVSPWLLLGDFNQIAATSDHFSVIPSSFSLRGLDDFQDCLRDNDLVDIPSRGVFFTWSNHQQQNPIIRKLDRALGNNEWFNSFSSAVAVFEPPGDSDHSPCIIQLENPPIHSKKSFKYFSFLASHHTFLECMKAAWQEQTLVGSNMFMLGERLKHAKIACRRLNRIGFGNLQQKTRDALSHLEDIQSQLLTIPSDSLFRLEHVARKRWNFFALALESFYRQKSRIRWLKEGDANTRFFHRAVIAHQAKNLIKYLRADDDSKVENVEQIKDMIVSYYTHLLGSENESTVPLSVETIKALHPFRCDDTLAAKLSAIPSEEEITLAFFSMPKNKAPGPDGKEGH
ncbi:unnamed protein product [Arabidopsis arenosa]|uniref:CCHC-type domain-containing protein n=1 Tax=Arabidopsis arenosa TaxID=38785 RepID=A0A8S2A8F0_ARAAE|nr:unnamed protein product [Arabidopsis arenosa]